MSADLERAETSVDRPRRVPRFFSCLVKGPLGCLSFVIGAAVVIVLLLPPALGRVLDSQIEEWFATHHRGSLEISDAWLGSFYGPQRIERLILRDPEGDEVLRGELRAPSLAEVFDQSDSFGPIVLRIDLLRLVEYRDGTTNLERALEAVPGVEQDSRREDGFSTDLAPREFELEILIARLRASSSRNEELELSDLAFRGKLEWGPEETRIKLEGGEDPDRDDELRARVELRRPEFGQRRIWSTSLALEHAPTVLARALCAPARALLPFAGEDTDRLSWTRDGREVALLVEDEDARFELMGEEQDGLVSGPEGSAITLTLPCASPAGRTLLATLLPLVGALECADPDAKHELRLADYRWPLDGDWSELSGRLELVPAPSRATFARWGEPLGVATLESLASPLRVSVRQGILEYSRLELPLEQGRLWLDGTAELESGLCDFTVSVEREGVALDPLRLGGPRDALVPKAPELPPVPDAPEAETPLPPDELAPGDAGASEGR